MKGGVAHCGCEEGVPGGVTVRRRCSLCSDHNHTVIAVIVMLVFFVFFCVILVFGDS